ncbi:MAG: HI0074 family nucleotidyltransferase substrate-binding subunit [Candidatus Gastranaerophilaceae bacterium]
MDIRWKQRFSNLELAHNNLIEMLDLLDKEPSSKAYKLAVIQSYEMDIELAWKTLKDYLNYLGYKSQAPREVIKQSFAIEIIEDGETWLKMLDDRNLTSHIYDEAKAQEVIDSIKLEYFSKLDSAYNFLKGKLND